ncbi:hypothetical protein [Haloplanus sp. C73]|uniref:hypothetical protein n=1 Tax=Haloplanus sp. C73 TaxID=3421641 RepID=UPI003EB6C634
MSIGERIEDLTGEAPMWWAVELYKFVFVLAGGVYIGWLSAAQKTTPSATTIAETGVAAPPEWLPWVMVPGILYLIVAAFPWPGLGSGGLSM